MKLRATVIIDIETDVEDDISDDNTLIYLVEDDLQSKGYVVHSIVQIDVEEG